MRDKQRIAFDASMITEKKAGIEYYAQEILRALVKQESNIEFYVYTANKASLGFLQEYSHVKIIEYKAETVNFLWHLQVRFHIMRHKISWIISPSNMIYGIWFKNTIQFVHDMATIKYPDNFKPESSAQYKKQLDACIKNCTYIATISQTTVRDITQYYPDYASKIKNVGIGLNDWMKSQENDPSIESLQKQFGFGENYIVSLSTLQPRKNYSNMIKAFSILKKDNPNLEYIIIGKKGWMFEDINKTIQQLQLEDAVHLLDYQPEAVVRTILKNAKVFVYASIWEGFGMPLIEAYSLGIPTVASDIAIFHEVMGDNSLYAQADDPQSIAQAVQKAIVKKTHTIDEKFLKQYTWDKAAKKLLKLTTG